MDGYAGGGSLGIPQFYLIDAKGKVVGDEPPTEAQLEKLLADVVDLKLDHKLAPALSDAERAYQRGLLGVAFAMAAKFADDPKSEVAKDARYLREMVQKAERHRHKQAAAELKGLSVSDTYGKLLVWKYDFAGLPFGEWAGDQLDALKKDGSKKKDPKLREEASAWMKLEAVLKREPKGLDSEYERKRVEQLYRQLLAKHRRTTPGAIAGLRLEQAGR